MTTATTSLMVIAEPAPRLFNPDESIARVREYEKRGTVFKILSGLELLGAKNAIRHGAWYAYLLKCGVYPTTATRRMTFAKDFIKWVEVQIGVKDLEIQQVMNIIEVKPCILHDFTQSLRVDTDKFCEQMVLTDRAISFQNHHQYMELLAASWYRRAVKIETEMAKMYNYDPAMYFSEERMFKDTLANIISRFASLKDRIRQQEEICEQLETGVQLRLRL